MSLLLFKERTLREELRLVCANQGIGAPDAFMRLIEDHVKTDETVKPEYRLYLKDWDQPYSTYPEPVLRALYVRVLTVLMSLHRKDDARPGSRAPWNDFLPKKIMEELKKTEFMTQQRGSVYALPKWQVVDGKGIEPSGDVTIIPFVRGSTNPQEGIEKQAGILHEALLAMAIADLEYKNSLVPNYFTTLAIDNMKTALAALGFRALHRKETGTLGTYKP